MAGAARQRLAPILPAIGVALAAFAWLSSVNPSFPFTDDSLRDQLLVRDCTDLGRCHLIGASSSVPGFYHGPVWLDLLIAVRLLGGDVASERTVVLAFLALSVATLFVVVWRWLRASLALPAAVLLIGVLSLDRSPSMLINPSVAAFPDILTTAGILCYGLSGQRRFLIVSAFTLGVGINVHIASLSLVAPLLAVAVLARPRPWRDVLGAVAVLGATCLLTSSAALRANFIAFTEYDRLLPALAGILAVLVVSAVFGTRFRRLPWDARAWIVGAILFLPFALASLMLVLWERHHFGIIYIHPILGPGAVLGAALMSLPFELGARRHRALRWMPTAASVAAMLFAGRHAWQRTGVATPPAWASWSLAEAAAVADHALGRGWSYEDLVFHVQGRACRELLTGISVAAPPPAAAGSRGRRQLQVVRVPRDAPPPLADADAVVPLEPTNFAVVREIDSWLQPEALRACRIPVGPGRAPVCSDAIPRATLAPERFLFINRSFPEVHGLDLPPPYIATYEIPVAPLAGESREVVLTDQAEPECGWRFTRAEGVQVDGPLPARRVRLHSVTGSPGVLVIEKPFGVSASCPLDLDMRYPPCVFESRPDDALLAFVEAG
jgi:hypothetical protein